MVKLKCRIFKGNKSFFKKPTCLASPPTKNWDKKFFPAKKSSFLKDSDLNRNFIQLFAKREEWWWLGIFVCAQFGQNLKSFEYLEMRVMVIYSFVIRMEKISAQDCQFQHLIAPATNARNILQACIFSNSICWCLFSILNIKFSLKIVALFIYSV